MSDPEGKSESRATAPSPTAILPFPKRRSPRAQVCASALVTVGGGAATEHMTYDLSAGGVRLCGRPLARVGDVVDVSLHLPGRIIRAAGRVLRMGRTRGRPDFAIQFSELAPHDEDAIHDAVVEALSAPDYRSLLLFQSRHDPRWPGWDWLRPLFPICALAITPLEALQCLHEYAIEIAILDAAGPAPRAADWNEVIPGLPWRTIDRAGRLHALGRDARLLG